MTSVKFYELGTIDNSLLTYAVVVSNYNGKWIYCKHKERDTWEIPAGHIDSGETPMDAARRELWEETGALEFDLEPICIYSITKYGLLCYATIKTLGEIPNDSEIEKICVFDYEPANLTYPLQSKLFEKVRNSKCSN